LHPQMAGLVARAVIETPEGNRRYIEQFRTLFERLFKPQSLSNRVTQITGSLSSSVDEPEFKRIQREGLALQARIMNRYHFLQRELNRAPSEPLQFKNGQAALTDWKQWDPPAAAEMNQVLGPDNVLCLHFKTRAEGIPSWRTKAVLNSGRYSFQARVRVSEVRPLAFGTHQGAGLRIAGQEREADSLVGTSPWRPLKADFEVSSGPKEIEFICEMRASAGEAWFDASSMRVVRLP